MPKNQDSLNKDLYGLLKTRGYRPEMYDSSGKSVPVPEEAEAFQFDFIKDGENYGKVTVTIDGLHDLNVYYGDNVAKSPKAGTEDSLSWDHLLLHLRRFAQQNLLSFSRKNEDDLKYDMSRREYTKREGLTEGYHAMGRKQSYNDVIPETKIVIKHSKNMEEGEQRFRSVEKIFIETSEGERFLAPTTKPGVAQVYARHIAEGGQPHDARWNHITGLVEEYTKMAGFVRATRGGQFNESVQQLVTEGLNHYLQLRENLGKLRGKKGYNTYFESWTPPLMEDEVVEDLSEMFRSSSLDPRIESVMPILSKLKKNLGEQVKMNEVSELEEWADSMLTFENNEEEADYGDDYQQMVMRVGQKAKEQEKKKPVDIADLAKRLNKKKDQPEQLDEFLPILGAIGGEMAGGAIAGELGLGAAETQLAQAAGGAIGQQMLDTDDEETTEGLDSDQRRAGQMGPTDKVSTGQVLGNKPQSQKGLRGKLVAESKDPLSLIKKLSGL